MRKANGVSVIKILTDVRSNQKNGTLHGYNYFEDESGESVSYTHLDRLMTVTIGFISVYRSHGQAKMVSKKKVFILCTLRYQH